MLFGLALSCDGAASQRLYRENLLPRAAAGVGASVELTWLGTAGVLLSDGETSLFIDPFVSRYGLLHVGLGHRLPPRLDLVEAWLARLRPKGVAAVLVSHSHYDHSLDAPYFAQQTRSVLVGARSTANIGRGAGLRERSLRVAGYGESMAFGRFRVTFLESRHGPALFGRVPYPGRIKRPLRPPARASQYRLGKVFSLLIEHPAGTVLHHGSASYLPGALAHVRADVVLLGLAGRADTADYLRNVVDAVAAKRVLALHFDNFFAPLEQPLGFLPFVRFGEFVGTLRRTRPTLPLGTLPIGEPVVLFGRGVSKTGANPTAGAGAR